VKITISGASGLIGRRLATVFAAEGHSVHALSRAGGRALGANASAWEPNSGEPPIEALRDAHAVIHLAGENVAQRWTDEARRRIRESRVTGTRSLVQALSKLQRRPEALICASAVGYYGSRGDEILTESSHPGTGFLPEVCVAWERRRIMLGCLLLFVFPGAALVAGERMFSGDDSQSVLRVFASPTRQFSTGPLWTWNDRLTEEDVRRTLRDLAGQQVKQAWVFPTAGLMTALPLKLKSLPPSETWNGFTPPKPEMALA
jgi:uncharacterized protein YbjT (DUF2867 family)